MTLQNVSDVPMDSTSKEEIPTLRNVLLTPNAEHPQTAVHAMLTEHASQVDALMEPHSTIQLVNVTYAQTVMESAFQPGNTSTIPMEHAVKLECVKTDVIWNIVQQLVDVNH